MNNFKLFYDARCGVCGRMLYFLRRNSNTRTTRYEDFSALNIWDSKYSDLSKKTIVVVTRGSEFTEGAAMREIFKIMNKPYSLLAYIPLFVLDVVYRFLRWYRTF